MSNSARVATILESALSSVPVFSIASLNLFSKYFIGYVNPFIVALKIAKKSRQ